MTVTLDQILTAMQVWETAELQPTYTDFVSYLSFPTQAQLDTGLKYPHTIHVWVGTEPKVMTIGSPAEVLVIWNVETYFVAGEAVNDLASLQARAAQQALAYLTGWLKHRGLGGLLTVKENQLIDCGFGEWDLFGMHIVGHKWLSKLTTRQTMTVGV